MDDDQIGFLVRGQHVVCSQCATETPLDGEGVALARLFRVNIGQYGQDCHKCGKVLVKPQTPLWPTLFDRKPCRACQT